MANQTNVAAETMLARIDDLVRARGENTGTMLEVGDLLRELAADAHFRFDVGEEPRLGQGIVVAQVLARGTNGAMLSVNELKAPWSPKISEKESVHWHNYWQALLLVRGNWEDTIWEEIDDREPITSESIRIARRELMHVGDVQILGPMEPHGWEAGEARNADDALLLYWTGRSQSAAHTEIDLATGALSERQRGNDLRATGTPSPSSSS